MPRPKKEAFNRSDNRYEVKMTIGKDISVHCLQKFFYSTVSKDDAKRKGLEYLNAMERGRLEEIIQNQNFAVWARTWLEVYKRGKVNEHTFNFTYKSNVEKYLIPFFGKMDIGDIKPIFIQGFFNNNSALSLSSLNKIKICLRDIFDTAIDNNLCYSNPVKNITISGKKAAERHVYTALECDKLLNYCRQNPSQAATGTFISLTSGVRRSELIGLWWDDVDLKNQLISIQRAVVPTTGLIVEDATKTAFSSRLIPIDRSLVEFMREIPHDGVYVVSNKTGDSFRSPNGYALAYRDFMKKASENLHIPVLTPHELRHIYGTLLRERGIDIYTISRAMGHASIEITAKIYVHNDTEVLRKAMLFDPNLISSTIVKDIFEVCVQNQRAA